MRRLAIPCLLAVVALAGCGSVTHEPRPVPPARPLEHGEVVPSAKGYRPAFGRAEHAVFRSNGCGVERWAQKTLTDPAAADVTLRAQSTWIGDLASIAPPANPTDRVNPTEDTTFMLSANLEYVKVESDGDLHLVLVDARGDHMIAESADPKCAAGSRVLSQMEAVRAAILARFPSGSATNIAVPVIVTGVGFFDRVHGQTGVAANGIELHPLIAIQFVQGAHVRAPQLHLSDHGAD